MLYSWPASAWGDGWSDWSHASICQSSATASGRAPRSSSPFTATRTPSRTCDPENGGAGQRKHTRAAGRAAKDQTNCGTVGLPRGEGQSATYRVDVAIHVLL